MSYSPLKKYHKRMSMVETTSETNEYHMQGFILGIFVRWGEHLAGETIKQSLRVKT